MVFNEYCSLYQTSDDDLISMKANDYQQPLVHGIRGESRTDEYGPLSVHENR